MKRTMDYAIVVEPLKAEDAGGWLATVPALPGCMGDGETREAATADALAAIEEWRDAAQKFSAIP
jgi:antitoxin HicB